MGASAEELCKFLAKRGFTTDVTKKGDTFTINVRSKTAEDIKLLLASIDEPGKFVISVDTNDISTILGVNDLRKYADEIRFSLIEEAQIMSRNTEMLKNTDLELKKQSEESISSLSVRLEKLTEIVEALLDRAEIQDNKKHWWEKILSAS